MRYVIAIVLLAGITSCSSQYYWSEYSTPYGAKAQNKYIRNARGHNPTRRFLSTDNPFGAVAKNKR